MANSQRLDIFLNEERLSAKNHMPRTTEAPCELCKKPEAKQVCVFKIPVILEGKIVSRSPSLCVTCVTLISMQATNYARRPLETARS